MATQTNIETTGTGQAGAGSPAGATKDVAIHVNGQGEDKVDQVANRAARRGLERQHREDPTEFTK